MSKRILRPTFRLDHSYNYFLSTLTTCLGRSLHDLATRSLDSLPTLGRLSGHNHIMTGSPEGGISPETSILAWLNQCAARDLVCNNLLTHRRDRKSGNEHTDFTLICEDQEFPVHRMIVGPRCEYLDKIMKGPWQVRKKKPPRSPVPNSKILGKPKQDRQTTA